MVWRLARRWRLGVGARRVIWGERKAREMKRESSYWHWRIGCEQPVVVKLPNHLKALVWQARTRYINLQIMPQQMMKRRQNATAVSLVDCLVRTHTHDAHPIFKNFASTCGKSRQLSSSFGQPWYAVSSYEILCNYSKSKLVSFPQLWCTSCLSEFCNISCAVHALGAYCVGDHGCSDSCTFSNAVLT